MYKNYSFSAESIHNCQNFAWAIKKSDRTHNRFFLFYFQQLFKLTSASLSFVRFSSIRILLFFCRTIRLPENLSNFWIFSGANLDYINFLILKQRASYLLFAEQNSSRLHILSQIKTSNAFSTHHFSRTRQSRIKRLFFLSGVSMIEAHSLAPPSVIFPPVFQLIGA